MITVVTVLEDGRHIVHQIDALPGHVSGVLIGAHLALRGHHYGDQVRRFVVVDRASVTEHDAGGAS
jgi:hypothetical protein